MWSKAPAPRRPTSSFWVKTQLEARVRPVLLDDPPRRFEHRRDRGLVVGAEDRPARVPDDAVLDDGLERPLRRHGVEVRAEEERRAAVGATG